LPTVVAVALAATVAACDHGDSNDESTAARPLVAAFNAVPDMASITFLREEEVLTTLEYGAGTAFRSVDAGQYDLRRDTGASWRYLMSSSSVAGRHVPLDLALCIPGSSSGNSNNGSKWTRGEADGANARATNPPG
jgi:hypothetical protein